MTNKTRIERLETYKTQLLNNRHVLTLPVEDWTRSMDALASVLSVTRAELENELQKLRRSTNNQTTRRQSKAIG